jgi:hypothetical protein
VAERAINGADVIFEGKTEKVELQGWPLRPETGTTVSVIPRMKVMFSGVRLYRGVAQDFVIETGIGGGDCGYRFEPGKSYLVYAWHEDSGELSTNICSSTSLLDDAPTELRLLRGDPLTPEDLEDLPPYNSPVSTTSPDRKLCGRLSFPKGRKATSLTLYFWAADQDAIPLPADEAESDEDGSFCIEYLKPGNYLIEALERGSDNEKYHYSGFFPGVKDRSQAQPILVKGKGSTGRADFPVFRQPLFHVRGYLRGAPKGDSNNLQVMVMSPEGTDVFHMIEPVQIGPRGFFEIREVPPGKYSVFAVRADDENETITFVSEIVDLDLHADVDGLKLQFVVVK